MERLAELNAMLNMDEKGGENLLADEGIGENPEVNVPEERQDRIADSVHKNVYSGKTERTETAGADKRNTAETKKETRTGVIKGIPSE